MMRSSPQRYCYCTGWDGHQRMEAHPDAAMGYPVQRTSRCTETGADAAGVAGFEWTNVAKCRVLEMTGDSGIGEASLGDVVELALPIVDAACAGGVEEVVPAGHLTDSAMCDKSQYMERCLNRALIIHVSWLRKTQRGVGGVQASRARLQQQGQGRRCGSWREARSAHQRSSSCNFTACRRGARAGNGLHFLVREMQASDGF